MATMRPIPYPISRPAYFSLFARLEAKGEWIDASHPAELRSLFGVSVCDMDWTDTFGYVEAVANLRHGPQALSFIDGRTAFRLSVDADCRAVLGRRVLLPASRMLAVTARLQGDGPLKASFDALRFTDALLTFLPRRHIALVGAKLSRLEQARERFAQHAPWHAFSVVRAADLGSGIAVNGVVPGLVATAPDLVIVDAAGYEEELRFEQALTLHHNGLMVMAGTAFGDRNS